jgi:cytochrome P450
MVIAETHEPSAPVSELATPEARDNPYVVYARWRESDPIHRERTGEWFLTRYDDISAVLADHDRFHSSLTDTRLYRERIQRLRADDSDMLFGDLSMVQTDPPDHTRLRRLVSKAFTPRAVARLRPRIEQIVAELLDAVDDRRFELIADLAYPLPVTVICELLGVPVADRAQFRGWNRDLIDNPDLSFEDTEAVARAQAAMRALNAYMKNLADERRRSPGEDLISGLVAAEERGDQLTTQELINTAVLLLIAGHETTVNLLGNGVLALLSHPEQLRRLREDALLIDSAIEEMLRYDSPVQAVSRGVTAEVEIRGVTLRPGDIVLCLVGAANRDPSRFEQPDTFDIGRQDSRHLSFGHGIHYCLGAPLARLEAQIAIPALLERFPVIEAAGGPPRWRPSLVLRGLEELPLRVQPLVG